MLFFLRRLLSVLIFKWLFWINGTAIEGAMGMKHHRICCIKIGLRGARMRKTSMLAVVKEGEGKL